MDKVIQILRFCRIVDAEGNISLSNIAMAATLVKLLISPAIAIPDLLVFLGTVANYSVRRAITQQPVSRVDEVAMLKDAISTLQTKVTTLQMKQ